MRNKLFFATDHYYHVYNRGVEKRTIFLDDEDYTRFIYYLFECNTKDQISDIFFPYRKKQIDFGSLTSENRNERKKAVDKLVDITCFVLMPNHFHLLLKQSCEKGISLFMQKLCTAYAKYFNNKYKRVGGLFQGTFQAKLIDKTEYLNLLFCYIFTNPIELIDPQWREKGIIDLEKVKKFLESYKWSSYQEILGKSNFPFLSTKEYILEFFENQKEFKEYIKNFIEDSDSRFNAIQTLVLD